MPQAMRAPSLPWTIKALPRRSADDLPICTSESPAEEPEASDTYSIVLQGSPPTWLASSQVVSLWSWRPQALAGPLNPATQAVSSPARSQVKAWLVPAASPANETAPDTLRPPVYPGYGRTLTTLRPSSTL